MIDRGEFTRKARSVALKVIGDHEKGRVFDTIEAACLVQARFVVQHHAVELQERGGKPYANPVLEGFIQGYASAASQLVHSYLNFDLTQQALLVSWNT